MNGDFICPRCWQSEAHRFACRGDQFECVKCGNKFLSDLQHRKHEIMNMFHSLNWSQIRWKMVAGEKRYEQLCKANGVEYTTEDWSWMNRL